LKFKSYELGGEIIYWKEVRNRKNIYYGYEEDIADSYGLPGGVGRRRGAEEAVKGQEEG
jgi:hypothetical protein